MESGMQKNWYRMCLAVALILSIAFAPETQARGLNDSFTIGLEQPVSNGVPGPGAGNLEAPGSTDTYLVTIAAPTTIYADALSGSCLINWSMKSPSNATVFSSTSICGTDPGVKVLTEVGTYTITVAATPTFTGTYSFTLWIVNAPEAFTIGLEQPVSNGNPAAGAGNLEEPGAQDVYTLAITAPGAIYAQDLSGSCTIRWKCTSPTGVMIFNDPSICGADPGIFSLTEIGDYTITVDSANGTTGTYSFTIWGVNPPQSFTITTKQTVANGAPESGAGNLEEPGAIDIYTLPIASPHSIYAESISGSCLIGWSLKSPSGANLFSNTALCGVDPGIFALTEIGDYTITVAATGEGTAGTYSFRIWDLNEPESFTIALDQVVSNGSPAAGAGNLEEPGAKDVYLLNLAAPATIFADSVNGFCTGQWSMTRPDGAPVFTNAALCSDPGQFLLEQTGLYTVTVNSSSGQTGTYSFKLTNVNPPQQFTLAAEQMISKGVPGPGAGNIETAGSADQYSIALTAGIEIAQDATSTNCALLWTLTAPSGTPVFADVSLCSSPIKHLITETGVHMLTVRGSGGATGQYSGVIWIVDPVQDFVIAVGDTVAAGVPGRGAGNLPEPFAIDRYSFSATAGTLVCFDPNSGGCSILWSVASPDASVLFQGIGLCGSPPGRFSLPLTGTYVITVLSPGGDTGKYGFTLQEGSIADISPDQGDCSVDASDLAVLLGSWGLCNGCAADLNGDGTVDAADLAQLLGEWQ
jgi:hypothetical protein